MSKTKIIATVGPSCNTKEMLFKLAKAGVNVFRLNFSHGLHEEKLEIITWIREINEENNINISILADIQGPKLRVGEMENNGVEFLEGDIITFVGEKIIGNKDRVYLSYPNLHLDVKVGDHIIDLGPEGGNGGGRILFEGVPELMVDIKESHTARFLKIELAN